jgi:phosphohistidine phosphatase
MRVYLVQHGESKSEEEDPQRRLTDKGIGEVQKFANFLRTLKLALDAVWHSGKARTQQTGELLAEAVGARDLPQESKAMPTLRAQCFRDTRRQ